jgi:dihydrofolate synthase/folylpolyglutamate synthase
MHIAPQLPGGFQLQNALNAVAAARVLQQQGFQIPTQALQEGIAATVWPGRLEKLHAQPDIYLDGAHNPGAARELAGFWEQQLANRRIFLVYGALRDKAVDEIAGILFPRAAEVIFTEPRTSRAISAAQLSEIAAHHASHSVVIADATQAFDSALAKAAPHDAIFITGSLYLVGQLRHYWKQRAQVAAR